MHEKITNRLDRQNRFGDIVPRNSMASAKLGRRRLSQFDRLCLRVLELIQNTVLERRKDVHTGNRKEELGRADIKI